MKNIFFKLTILLILAAFVSCDLGKNPEVGGTSVQDMTGDWYVELLDIDGNVLYPYFQFSTYNLSSNIADSIWIDDHETWPMKIKVPVKYSDLGFSASDTLYNNYYSEGLWIRIIEGKVIKDAAKSIGGNTTDSIRLVFEAGDDEGVQYVYQGHRRTGFLEDEL
jgi:hypothetical protein